MLKYAHAPRFNRKTAVSKVTTANRPPDISAESMGTRETKGDPAPNIFARNGRKESDRLGNWASFSEAKEGQQQVWSRMIYNWVGK